ncbi:glycerophosphodiester phosphodiesterase family protein [Lacrimispora xylanolytica]|uniref:Glycerophosphodiester phosphodiesterase family protein n=1 Tax=Lacrimispora xylanolytica TaxID=29375 RepID=A0ABY7AE23_9FIRM|nr:glycerophosphodiester phosphodiesterase family protein [Lacrimispora xylanolytica]WAJ24089.1 glycerophosphodiester phosphodiesterase family protein [Lacrimispora xylanolytica]
MYPENTLLAFSKAKSINKLTGIELDIQMSKDGHMVVFHDERVDRVTNGIGEVRLHSLSDLKKLRIRAENGIEERIPTIEEVLDLLEPSFEKGLKLNIELKNSDCPYDGMEEKIIDLIHTRDVQNYIIYSSFSAISLEKIKKIDPLAETGILDRKVSDCLFKLRGGCGATALHPHWKDIDLEIDKLKGYNVRAWFTGHLYPEKPTGVKLNLEDLESKGITDVFLNEPEIYL